jgi:hypothetical protein
MSHEIVKCKKCEKIIRQCRCFDCIKPTIYEICDDCEKDDISKLTEKEHVKIHNGIIMNENGEVIGRTFRDYHQDGKSFDEICIQYTDGRIFSRPFQNNNSGEWGEWVEITPKKKLVATPDQPIQS